ncbi:MAG: hypothetical protein A2W91_09940 [Bacteroidetes bacterium GWF2_38_335]|nr:MAG: hypothetical protein A2W91_09940 [Bacteroidetes bacterium GWF2_38_335]HBS88052.1 hypothetical protein [Bacteroidales bacterium]
MEFSNELRKKLKELNRRRKIILFRNVLLTYIVLAVIFISSFFIPIIDNYSFQILFAGIVFCLFINWIIDSFDNSRKKYYHDLKTTIVPYFIEKQTKNFVYEPKKYIHPTDYLKSGFGKERFHKTDGHDLIKVIEDNYLVMVSFFTTYILDYKSHRGGARQHTTALFKGLFMAYYSENIKKSSIDHDLFPWQKMKIEDKLYLRYEYSKRFCEPSLFENPLKSSTHMQTEEIIKLIFEVIRKI